MFDVAEEETTEDFHKTAAVTPIRGSYSDAHIPELYSKRIGWLLALVFVNIFRVAQLRRLKIHWRHRLRWCSFCRC